MKLLNNKYLYILLFSLLLLSFFWPVTQGRLPIPTDTLVGLYHPWRDALKQKFPNGYPYKNALITDPIRQQIPYRKLAIDQLKHGQLPKWNPYSFSGTPLLANVQSAALYPLNFIFWLTSFVDAWTILIILQPALAFIFMFWYLRNLQLKLPAAFLGGVSFSFSGFMVAWLTWNTIGHVALWLPLMLLTIDKLVEKFLLKWMILLVFAEVSAFLGGHFQIALYLFTFVNIYIFARLWQKSQDRLDKLFKRLIPFVIRAGFILLLMAIQLLPSIDFIAASARQYDLPPNLKYEWFLPYKHLIQFVAPDFFGNPATGNYFGKWNYAEFVGYIGLIPLLFSLTAICFRRDKKTLFFGLTVLFGLLAATPNLFSKIPYLFNFPLISLLQPTRIIVLICFSLAVLAALGLDYFLKNLSQKLLSQILATGLIVVVGWLMTFMVTDPSIGPTQILVMRRNMLLPTMIFVTFAAGIIFVYFRSKFTQMVVLAFLIMTTLDLFRFTNKFTPFSPKEFFFPQTSLIKFLQDNLGIYRFMTLDRRIFPANTSVYFKLATVDGYDPLYLLDYSQFVGAWTRNRPDITPATFHRIITPEKPTWLASLLGVKYILSLTELDMPQIKLVFTEGETKIYENLDVFPRAFLVEELRNLPSKQSVIEQMFADVKSLKRVAYTDALLYIKPTPLTKEERVQIEKYSENEIILNASTKWERLLVLTDIYYPEWRVYVDGNESVVFPVDLIFRGVVIPRGKHKIVFRI